ncbi:MAG: hypothetical protein ACOYNY_20770 [Caldilineaceae bacterium]|jgi:hypothetical protein
MNTLTFVFGQLLTLEMLAAGRRQTVRQRLLDRLNNNGFGRRTWLTQRGKEFVMDNSILVILFLIVTLIANFAMPSSTEK